MVGCYLCYKRWKIATGATEEEKIAIEHHDEQARTNIAMWLMVAFCIAAFLEVVAVGGGIFAALWLGFMLFFA